MIRASQGHSIEIQLGYDAIQPPAFLFHGTARKNLPSIQKNGLQKGQRHDVHLTEERSTAVNVGGRHGEAVVLTIQAEKMFNAGYLFYYSENGVWLTQEIPPAYIWFD